MASCSRAVHLLCKTKEMRKTALVIMDGWGLGLRDENDATHVAETPTMDGLLAGVHAQLITHGEDVGLPAGQMGNSEVGHMNIGAGRVVYQDLLRIDRAIEDGSFANEPALKAAMSRAASKGRLHLMGLVSQGGVHAQQAHLHALLDVAQAENVAEVFVHVFTDGRDTAPMKGGAYVQDLETHLSAMPNAQIATVSGRYFAMDRDERWDRVERAYDALVRGGGPTFSSAAAGIDAAYADGTGDEFIEPFCIEGVAGQIAEGDTVLCFNFRTDRCREITRALTQEAFSAQNMLPLDLDYVTMTQYDARFKDVKVIYHKPDLEDTLGAVISAAGLGQFRTAETEKYPHVTFFFNGGREAEFQGEQRKVVPSPGVSAYDQQPEMSAEGVAQAGIDAMQTEDAPHFLCLNFANPDMVGHTGVFDAVCKAVETADTQLARVLEATEKRGYSVVVIADHGNAELARNPDGSPHTAHTTNLVPLVVIDPRTPEVLDGRLADIAPTVLALIGLEQPAAMTGRPLVKF
jgi:2,3-bisphosphoglycerate-independent phosphoglycerate mutase